MVEREEVSDRETETTGRRVAMDALGNWKPTAFRKDGGNVVVGEEMNSRVWNVLM